ncbi:MAG: hypothetical protein KF847_18570 [Pirellulales bacterium]|nr:hypothetical protein [Pirellulales bacterium]
MIRIAATLLVTACAVAQASAGTYNATIVVDIFGKPYSIDIYRVAGDLAGFGPQLQPEGMVWHDGTLYVTGDAGAQAPLGSGTETNGHVAAYAGGNLAATPAALGQFATSGRAIGPEAITINARGAGYGSFAGPTPKFVVMDSAGGSVGRILGVLDPAGPSVGEIQSDFLNGDDLAFVPGATAAEDRLAIIESASPSPVLTWYSTDATPVSLGVGFALADDAKGLLYLPQADAAYFSPLATTDCFMVSVAGAVNELQLYSLDGVLLASSALPTGTGSGLFGGVEALAYDPIGKRLFLGDENALSSQIGVAVQVPEPCALALAAGLASGLVAAVRFRRGRPAT